MTGDKSKNTSVRIFSEYLKSTRRRSTPERYMILRSAEQFKKPFSVEELCARLETEGRHVAVATVYSTLQLLAACGLALRHNFDGRKREYEMKRDTGADTSYVHLSCLTCGKVRKISDAELAALLKARRFTRFTPVSFALTVQGVCSACARKAKVAEKKKNNSNKSIHKKVSNS